MENHPTPNAQMVNQLSEIERATFYKKTYTHLSRCRTTFYFSRDLIFSDFSSRKLFTFADRWL